MAFSELEGDEQLANGALFAGTRKTYKFTVGIMTVNKTIGGETQAFFQNQNRFVRVAFDALGFQMLRALMDLPVVAKLAHGKRIGQHCLSVDIKCPRGARPLRKVIHNLPSAGDNKGCLVICLQSFGRLCEILRFLTTMELPDVPWVTSARNEKLSTVQRSFFGGVPGLLHIKISGPERLDQRIKPGSPPHEFLLNCLQSVRGGGYALVLTGIGAGLRVDEVKAKMATPIVFPVPFMIDRMQVVRNAKSHVDTLAARGQLEQAFIGYGFLRRLDSLWWQLIHSSLDNLSPGLNKAIEELFLPANLLTLDILSSQLAVSIQLGTHAKAQEVKESLDEYQGAMTPRMRSTYSHLCVIAAARSVPHGDPLDSTRVLMCQKLVDILESLEVRDSWIEHDLGKLQAFVRALRKNFIQNAPSELANAMTVLQLDDDDAADSQIGGQGILVTLWYLR